jgi:NUDIX domain
MPSETMGAALYFRRRLTERFFDGVTIEFKAASPQPEPPFVPGSMSPSQFQRAPSRPSWRDHHTKCHHLGTWGLPGGALNFDETPDEAAMREAAEETGVMLDRTR